MDRCLFESSRPRREIRAVFGQERIRIYQAFPCEIALPALPAQRFAPPFRFSGIVTWIKPSFLWTMKRSSWGTQTRIGSGGKPEHPGNAVVLGIEVTRAFFDWALSVAHHTHFEEFLPDYDPANRRRLWRDRMRSAPVRVQWDPEKDLDGNRLDFKTIQVGLRDAAIARYQDAIVSISDMSPLMGAIQGAASNECRMDLLPDERPYPVSPDVQARLSMSS